MMDDLDRESLVKPSSQSCPYGNIHLTEEADYEQDLLQTSSTSKGFRWKSLCRVEVCTFLQMLELGLHIVIKTNLAVAKVCKVDLNLGDDICNDIGSHPSEQDMVQEKVNNLHLYNLVLENPFR